MEDETPSPGWQIDPETRAAMRLTQVRAAMDRLDYAEAIIEVEELLDEDPDNPEGLFLLGESLLEVGDATIAVGAYTRCVSLTGGDARSLLGLAISRFDTCDIMGAVEATRECIRLDPACAEGHWYLGLSLERLPDQSHHAVQAFSAARQLEPEAYPYPLELTDTQWARAVGEAVGRLHALLAQFWDGVTILFDDLPSLEALGQHVPPVPPTVVGLYDGTPPTEDDPWQQRPPALRLFRRNLSRSRNQEELVEQVALALQSEALDWLGLLDISELSAEPKE